MDLRSIINTDSAHHPAVQHPPEHRKDSSESWSGTEPARGYGSPTAASPAYSARVTAHSIQGSPYGPSPSSAVGPVQFPLPTYATSHGSDQGGYARSVAKERAAVGLPHIQTAPHQYAHPLPGPSSLSPVPTSAGHYPYGPQYHPQSIHPSPVHSSPSHPSPAPHSSVHQSPTSSIHTLHTHPQDSPTSSAQAYYPPYGPPHYPHPSQPSTPLGPPPGLPQSSPALRADPPRPEMSPAYHSPRLSSDASRHPRPDEAAPDPSGTTMSAPAADDRARALPAHGHPPSDAETMTRRERERERSVSVSPKTTCPPQPRRVEAQGPHETRWSGQRTGAKRKQEQDPALETEDSSSIRVATAATLASTGEAGESNAQDSVRSQSPVTSIAPGRPYFDPIGAREVTKESGTPSPSGSKQAPAEMKSERTSTTTTTTSPKAPSPHPSTTPPSTSRSGSPAAAAPRPRSSQLDPPSRTRPMVRPSGPGTSRKREAPAEKAADATVATATSASSSPPRAKKRPRRDEPPIFARKAGRGDSKSPHPILHHQPGPGMGPASIIKPGGSPEPLRPPASGPSTTSSSSTALTETHVTTQEDHPCPAPVVVDDDDDDDDDHDLHISLPRPQPERQDDGPLGLWEPSITNVIPYEEVTRKVMDFLFVEVVERIDVGLVHQAGLAGAQLEIEAKLGQLVDKNTNDRLRLPILTESIFNKDHPSWRTTFRSSMTESQHRTLNQFLNKTVLSSNPRTSTVMASSSRPRVPLKYVHTRELDRFYELPANLIPPIPASVRPLVNQRHRVRVRVTHDQRTGERLAQIIKIRIADLDVYSPRTAFDWRISVNLEMNYDGDLYGMTEISEHGKSSKRSKDRMTYQHLAYQIDLTQVTLQSDSSSTSQVEVNNNNNKVKKEHELEIEISAQAVREQGLLAKLGQVNGYEDLIKGFVDNVRTLARVVNHAG